MRKASTRARRTVGWLLCALVLTVYFSPQAQLLRTLPGTLSVAHGQSAVLDAPFPLTMEIAQAGSSTAESLSQVDARAQTSTATISRINKCLLYGADGYKRVLERLGDTEPKDVPAAEE